MKLITGILLLALVQNSFAKQGGNDYTCRSLAIKNQTRTQVQLHQLNHGRVEEGLNTPYEITIQTVHAKTFRPMGKALVYRGFVQTEDVMFKFESLNKQVEFMIFMDEENENWLKVTGQKHVIMSCELTYPKYYKN